MSRAIVPIDPKLTTLAEMSINGIQSDHTRRAYRRDILDFLEWWQDRSKPKLNKAEIDKYKAWQRRHDRGTTAINRSLSAVRRFIREAADNNLIDPRDAESACKVENIKHRGVKSGMWLTLDEARQLVNAPPDTKRGQRDRMALSVLIGAGLRRGELCALTAAHIQKREGRWIISDIIGKRNKARTIPIAGWVHDAIQAWVDVSEIKKGRLLVGVHVADEAEYLKPFPTDTACTQEIWRIIERYKGVIGKDKLAPHDLRRTYAKLARTAGAPLEQIQLTLGHDSLDTTKKYLGSDLDYKQSPSDLIDLGKK